MIASLIALAILSWFCELIAINFFLASLVKQSLLRKYCPLYLLTKKVASEEDPNNFILMQAISANVSGQLGSAIAGGVIIAIVGLFV